MEEADIERAAQNVQKEIQSALYRIQTNVDNVIMGTEFCIDCDEQIPEARRKANPNARRCIHCQSNAEK